jgi:hypothetical protein
MTALVQQRCRNHAHREAVARCPECGRFFCRECISEHDDRILCTACLARLSAPVAARRSGVLAGVWLLAQTLVAIAAIWFFFFLVGRALIAIPSDFHEGSAWDSLSDE